MEKPGWWNDSEAQEVVQLLRWFIQKLPDSADEKVLSKKLTADKFPIYFNFSSDDGRIYIAEIFRELTARHIVDLIKDKNEDITKVVFNRRQESLLRDWLDMPSISLRDQAWQQAIAQATDDFVTTHRQTLLALGCLNVFEPEELLHALIQISLSIPTLLATQKKYSWRQLSARFFQGTSKFLDVRWHRDYVLALVPELTAVLKERSIQVSVVLARQPKAILFIENWDTHCWLAESPDICTHFHLVYAAGYRTSAEDIRLPENVSFFFSGHFLQMQHFKDCWFSASAQTESFPAFFWGDLDYSGMGILKTLQSRFNNIQAWRPGYEPMLAAIRRGIGHKPEHAEKENQRPVEHVQCDYAQQVLIPALRETGLMLDQEWLLELPANSQSIYAKIIE